MPEPHLPGGPTQDEIMAVSLFKLGLCPADTVLEIGCGTGRVSVAIAQQAGILHAVDRRPEAVATATGAARNAGISNIVFSCAEAAAYLDNDRVYDCAFLGGTKDLAEILPAVVKKVRRTLVINAVMVSTLERSTGILKDLGVFQEAVQVQVSRSHEIAGSIMFRPIDPVFIIVARGAACS